MEPTALFWPGFGSGKNRESICVLRKKHLVSWSGDLGSFVRSAIMLFCDFILFFVSLCLGLPGD